MDNSQPQHPPPAPQGLLNELSNLGPALQGFPVDELLQVYVTAGQQERANAYRLVDLCLESWIASLEGSLHAYPHAPDDALQRVRERQRSARDALSRLQTALARADGVVPGNRGQVC